MKIATVNNEPLKVPYTNPTAFFKIADRLNGYLNGLDPARRIAVVCLGTDRCTGDSLGPLTGSSLIKFRSPMFDLYGTLESPVHALNLDETLRELHRKTRNPFIIGIDACLGQASSVGCIEVGEGPVLPGAGVKKQLPPVGNIHMTGIVNVGGFAEVLVLQNTRLHVVMGMAELISRTLFRAISVAAKGQKEIAPAAGIAHSL
ncbi:sporulation protein [Paenibacillus darwinianus]|uniref:Sporulation protein n=1 Tax=Paenibacillus darwinianus TaxID=1380763 RepID=A0A9W5W6C2_9BACL|nr:spore protease YyaC [Paenibacillus darwinianus]EXX85204.1 sporulation protein [Paenibacillus darwinianus]EXX85272.1 sporulation protein [Paenibacillus darwinianus]EXX85453.1 sporulation protein [Paenibacillus darwinianus]